MRDDNMTKFHPYIEKIITDISVIYTIYSSIFFFENIGKKSSYRHKVSIYKALSPIISSYCRHKSS